MSQFMRPNSRLTVVALSVSLLAVGASSASASSLKIKVPSHLKSAQVFKIVVKGSYRSSQLTGTAFLVIAIQATGNACKKSAQKENQVKAVNVYFHNSVTSSPFKASQKFKASGTGSRRVCAYLYPQFVTPTSTIAPIARASKGYRTG